MNNTSGIKHLAFFCVLAVTAGLFLCSAAAAATTHNVNTTADHDDGACDGTDCTLREAIKYASAGDTVEFGLDGTITLDSVLGEIVINKNLTIDGRDGLIHNQTIVSGNNLTRVFNVTSGTVTIQDLVIKDGRTDQSPGGGGILNDGSLTLDNVAVANCTAYFKSGGGIYNRGTLLVTDSLITLNFTQGGYVGAGIQNEAVSGAAVLNMQDTEVSRNQSESHGGGVSSFAGQVTLTRCTFDRNETGSGSLNGGALYLAYDEIMINDCTFSDNVADGYGGAIYATYPASFTISGTTFTGNSSGRNGGAIWQQYGNLSVINSTFTGNTADQDGGALHLDYLDFSPASTLSFTTISGNTADADCGGGGTCEDGDGGGLYLGQGKLRLRGVILAGNSDASATTVHSDISHAGGTLESGGYSLIGDNTGASASFPIGAPNANNDYAGDSASPLTCALEALADNGGETQTCALSAGSLAVNHGPPDCLDAGGVAVPTDQRGMARMRGGRADIGAYEVPAGSGAPLAVLLE